VAQPTRRRAADWRLLAGVGAGAAAATALFVRARPDLAFTSAFLFQDQGNHLLVAARVADGAVLYRDVAYPYGPLPAMLGAAVAATVGPSAVTYVFLQSLLTAVFLVLLAHGLIRHVPPRVAAAVALLGVLPLAMAPGPLAGGAASNTYLGLERLLLVVLVLSWTPPEERTDASSAAAGLALGAWQWVKFGGAAFGLAAWLLVDVIAAAGRGGDAWRRVARSLAVLALAALAIDGLRWAALFATLPAPVALETAWPGYTLAHYLNTPDAVRGRGLAGIEVAQVAWMTTTLVLTAVSAPGRRRAPGDRAALALLLPPAFFVAGCAGYFGHRDIMWHYAWSAVPGVALAFRHPGRFLRPALGLAALPAALVLAAGIAVAARGRTAEPVRMPNGDWLWMTAAARDAAAALLPLFERDHASGRTATTVVVPSGGGLNFYADTPAPTRHVWVTYDYVRPHEFDDTRERLHRVERVAFMTEPGLTLERFDERAGAIFGPPTQHLWRGRLARIEHHPGWSLVTLTGGR
jgi:hypothetical protein